MRKHKIGRKLSRERDQRKALLKGLARALFVYEKIETTEAKAKEVSRFAEKCITRAKKDDLSARRHLLRFFDKKVVDKLLKEIAKKYKKRDGGYTRVVKLGKRKSDASEMAIISLVE